MIPTNRYSVSSPMPLDLNHEDQNHQFFISNHEASSSTSSLLYPIVLQPGPGSYYREPKHLQSDHEEAEKIIPSSGSWEHPIAEKDENSSDLKMKVWNEKLDEAEDGSVKWMSSKMRMMPRMMVSDQTGSDIEGIFKQKYEEQKQPLSPLGTDNSSNINVRVCADCHTTKTPLWRSGPRGPKSLCNACGIRQRKARRAMAAAAAAASANGTILMASDDVKENKLHSKKKKPRTRIEGERAPKLIKKRKLGGKKFGFEELTMSLSKNLALQQDEKEAAILLMALSYGLLHGFPSDRYLDL